MAEEILRMVNITKKFAGVTALDNVNFSCNKGEVHIIAGGNGAGKSTILKILTGINQADNGEIYFNDKPVHIKTPKQAYNLGIAMVYQELTLVRELTVAENIYLNQEPKTKLGLVDKTQIDKNLEEIMERYGIYLATNAIVDSLSMAEQQMAEILKILIRDPQLIILDEPTSALARNEVEQLFVIIRNLITTGKTVIFISHRSEEVFEIGDRITVLKDGHYVDTCDMKDMNEDKLVKMMVGRSLDSIFQTEESKIDRDKIMFEVESLTDAGRKVNDISFQVYKGEVLGIAGLQGHGQSEILHSISGLHLLNKGTIKINKEEIEVKNAGQALDHGIALVPADRKSQGLMLDLSIRHNLSIASLKDRLKWIFIDKKAENKFIKDIVNTLSIKIGGSELMVSSLSGGNQQKVVLGKELATKPNVILFDEPTRGIDVETKREFYLLMHELANDGVAVIMNSSDMMEVIGVCDRVLVIYEGKVSGILEKEDLTEENIMQLAMGMKKDETRVGETG